MTCCHSGTGRRSSTTTSVSPRTIDSHSPNSSALDTVADSETTVTDAGRWMITSSHTTPESVGKIVNLVHDDVTEPRERRRARVKHVAQDFGRHHDDRRFGIHRVVAGEQAHPGRPMPGDEVVVLLVRQSLDRRRVEALATLLERQMYRKLPDYRLSGSGWCCDQDAPAARPPGRPEPGTRPGQTRSRPGTGPGHSLSPLAAPRGSVALRGRAHASNLAGCAGVPFTSYEGRAHAGRRARRRTSGAMGRAVRRRRRP